MNKSIWAILASVGFVLAVFVALIPDASSASVEITKAQAVKKGDALTIKATLTNVDPGNVWVEVIILRNGVEPIASDTAPIRSVP